MSFNYFSNPQPQQYPMQQPLGGMGMNPPANPVNRLQQDRQADQFSQSWRNIERLIVFFGGKVKALEYYANSSKEEMQIYLKELQKENSAMSSRDSNRFEQLKRKCNEMQNKNEEIRREVFRVQDEVLRLANSRSKVVRHPQMDAQLYRRVSETKRILAEIDRRLYEIRSIPRQEMREEQADEKPLKDLELGVQVLTLDASKRRIEWDAILRMLNVIQ